MCLWLLVLLRWGRPSSLPSLSPLSVLALHGVNQTLQPFPVSLPILLLPPLPKQHVPQQCLELHVCVCVHAFVYVCVCVYACVYVCV